MGKRIKKNRKRNKQMSVSAKRTLNMGGIIAILFVMVIFNMLAKTSAETIQKEIGEKTRTLERLEEERIREDSRWERMKSPESVNAALLSHGLKMNTPIDAQIVRMGGNRLPLKGQLSVKRAMAAKSRNVARR